jgi:hypothetical protein
MRHGARQPARSHTIQAALNIVELGLDFIELAAGRFERVEVLEAHIQHLLGQLRVAKLQMVVQLVLNVVLPDLKLRCIILP